MQGRLAALEAQCGSLQEQLIAMGAQLGETNMRISRIGVLQTKTFYKRSTVSSAMNCRNYSVTNFTYNALGSGDICVDVDVMFDTQGYGEDMWAVSVMAQNLFGQTRTIPTNNRQLWRGQGGGGAREHSLFPVSFIDTYRQAGYHLYVITATIVTGDDATLVIRNETQGGVTVGVLQVKIVELSGTTDSAIYYGDGA